MATIKFGLEWGDKVSLKMDPHRIISHILRLQDKNAKTPSMIREE